MKSFEKQYFNMLIYLYLIYIWRPYLLNTSFASRPPCLKTPLRLKTMFVSIPPFLFFKTLFATIPYLRKYHVSLLIKMILNSNFDSVILILSALILSFFTYCPMLLYPALLCLYIIKCIINNIILVWWLSLKVVVFKHYMERKQTFRSYWEVSSCNSYTH